MSTASFFQKIRTYHDLSEEAEVAWTKLLRPKVYKKAENFINEGQQPRKVAFVIQGLFSQYYPAANGDLIIKYFFPERRLAASVSAMLSHSPSLFTITAIEDTTVWEYDFFEFKNLFVAHPDIAAFYINYIELHWIIEKEPLEVSFREDTAKTRYDDFLRKYPNLVKRLKKHHIASFLGITPTQLSRIFFSNK
ncbi:MAG TPA: Crp/Fnr family transcriptional regulator [Puia sp.]|jgi:CRP-like cAMP-binding protein|nr:Crp/Fnr family transcriptional regulator [Puia sp.]